MSKNNKDYDNVFKTLKHSHKRLFISVINNAFHKNYPLNTIPVVLPTDSYIENPSSQKTEERESDLLFNICGDTYLIECQSYEDGSMAIRIAEYAFLSARNHAHWENGTVTLTIPAYTVVYVKSNDKTPLTTEITFRFPNGEEIHYNCQNILLAKFSKEELIANRLYPYIPYYITRYEKLIAAGQDISPVLSDLKYFRDELTKLYQANELSPEELLDIMSYSNKIIRHIADGNIYEERMVEIMGGNIEETPSEKLKRLQSEKIALNLFQNGVDYDTIRKSIPLEFINDDRLTELMQMTASCAK